MTDRRIARAPLPEIAAAAVRGGADWVQIREKDLDGGPLYELACAIRDAVRAVRGDARVLVNRRVDVALAAGLDGVHLGFDAMPAPDARKLLGPDRLIGVSAHSLAEVDAARRDGASYAHLAPIFVPFSKAASRDPLGIEALAKAARRGLPLLAQGGIDAERAAACVRAGAAGVAVTREICAAEDPERAARSLRIA